MKSIPPLFAFLLFTLPLFAADPAGQVEENRRIEQEIRNLEARWTEQANANKQRERENRKNQRVVETKEVQLSATIEENDVLTKAKMAQKFLQGGDKVKVSIRFRGRQITHSEIGMQVMQNFAARCAEVSSVERRPMMDGRHMIMILAPKAAKASFAEKKAARENAKGNQEKE